MMLWLLVPNVGEFAIMPHYLLLRYRVAVAVFVAVAVVAEDAQRQTHQGYSLEAVQNIIRYLNLH